MKNLFDLFKKKKKEPKPSRLVTFEEIGGQMRLSILFLMIATLLVVLLLELPMKAQAFFDNSPNLFWLASFLSGALFILLTRWADKDQQVSFLPAENIKSIVLAGLFAGGLLFLWMLVMNQVFDTLFPVLYPDIRSSSNLYDPQFLIIAALSTIITLPLGEELLFRGLLLRRVSERRSPQVALVLVAALYGLRTLDPFGFFTSFGTGLLLGWLSQRFHLASAIIAHVFANIMILTYLTLL